MSRSRPFSIYLLKEDYNASNALKGDHDLKEVEAATLPPESRLFLDDRDPRKPWWKDYFGVPGVLNQVSKGAMVFLNVKGRCFALCFGHVYHDLEDFAYEYDFGLRVTLNCVNPDELKSTSTLEPEAHRRRMTQVPVPSDLTFFDFDHDKTMLQSLTGKVKDEYKHFFRNATGASNLRVNLTMPAQELPGFCEQLLGFYESEEFLKRFPEIQNISPVKDPVLKDKLDKKLLEAFHSEDKDLIITVPDIIDYADSPYLIFAGCKPAKEVYEDIFARRYYDYLRQCGKDISTIQLEDFYHHHIKITDEDGKPKGNSYPIYRCFAFDTSLSGISAAYHLSDGHWYMVEGDYVSRINRELDLFCRDIPLPAYNHDNEDAYNRSVPQTDNGYFCMHGNTIRLERRSPIEPCDLYAVEGERAVFYHVKISTLSQKLSHLFSQGVVAVEMLRSEEQARKALLGIINASPLEEAKKSQLKSPLDKEEYVVVFAIITHKDKSNKSLNLPLFSRINLLRSIKALKISKVNASYGFIEDKKERIVRAKKKRGKKQQ